MEFCLVDASTGKFVDDSVFANTDTLNSQEEYISDLYDALTKQYIPIELIHSESGPGQIEIVLTYSNNPIEIADNVVVTVQKHTVSNVMPKGTIKEA